MFNHDGRSTLDLAEEDWFHQFIYHLPFDIENPLHDDKEDGRSNIMIDAQDTEQSDSLNQMSQASGESLSSHTIFDQLINFSTETPQNEQPDQPQGIQEGMMEEQLEPQIQHLQPQTDQPSVLEMSLDDLLKKAISLVQESNDADEPDWWAHLDSCKKFKMMLCVCERVSKSSLQATEDSHKVNLNTGWIKFRNQLRKISTKKARKDELMRNLYISFTTKLLTDHAPEYKRSKNFEKQPYLQRILREHYKMPPAMVKVYEQYENLNSKKRLKVQLRRDCPQMYDDFILYLQNEYHDRRVEEFKDWVCEAEQYGCFVSQPSVVCRFFNNKCVTLLGDAVRSLASLLNKRKANYWLIENGMQELKMIFSDRR